MSTKAEGRALVAAARLLVPQFALAQGSYFRPARQFKVVRMGHGGWGHRDYGISPTQGIERPQGRNAGLALRFLTCAGLR